MSEFTPVQQAWIDDQKGQREKRPTSFKMKLFFYTILLVELLATVGLFYWAFNPESVSVPVGNLIKFASGGTILMNFLGSVMVSIGIVTTFLLHFVDVSETSKDKDVKTFRDLLDTSAEVCFRPKQSWLSFLYVWLIRTINVCFIIGIVVCEHPWFALLLTLVYVYQLLGTWYIKWSYKTFVKKLTPAKWQRLKDYELDELRKPVEGSVVGDVVFEDAHRAVRDLREQYEISNLLQKATEGTPDTTKLNELIRQARKD